MANTATLSLDLARDYTDEEMAHLKAIFALAEAAYNERSVVAEKDERGTKVKFSVTRSSDISTRVLRDSGPL